MPQVPSARSPLERRRARGVRGRRASRHVQDVPAVADDRGRREERVRRVRARRQARVAVRVPSVRGASAATVHRRAFLHVITTRPLTNLHVTSSHPTLSNHHRPRSASRIRCGVTSPPRRPSGTSPGRASDAATTRIGESTRTTRTAFRLGTRRRAGASASAGSRTCGGRGTKEEGDARRTRGGSSTARTDTGAGTCECDARTGARSFGFS